MSKRRPRPFPAFSSSAVRILASPIAHGFRYSVRPKGHARVTAYTLDQARATARRYSRRIVEEGPAAAFDGRGRG
jgi:hypothetical protein